GDSRPVCRRSGGRALVETSVAIQLRDRTLTIWPCSGGLLGSATVIAPQNRTSRTIRLCHAAGTVTICSVLWSHSITRRLDGSKEICTCIPSASSSTLCTGEHEQGLTSTMTFGERIRQLRKAKNLHQNELAAKVGINFTYLSKIENDKLETGDFPSEDTIKKLAKALGADADELLLMAKKV